MTSEFIANLKTAQAKLGKECHEYKDDQIESTGLIFFTFEETEVLLHCADYILERSAVPSSGRHPVEQG